MIFWWVSLFLSGTQSHGLTLSLKDCLEKARTRSLQAVQGSLVESQSAALRDELQRARYPQLVGVANYEKSDDVKTQLPDANKAVVRLEQSAFPYSAAWVRANQREADLRAAHFTHLELQADVVLLVKQLYFSILRGQDAIERLSQVEEQLSQLLSAVIPRYSVGRSPPFDLIKIKTSIADLARTREMARAQRIGEMAQLLQVLGLTEQDNLELRPVENLPRLAGVKDAPASDAQANPTLLALEQQLQAAELGVRAARYNRWPLLVGALEYGYAGQTSEDLSRGWSFTLGLRLPLFDWGVISAQIQSESALVALAENKFSLEKQRARADLAASEALAVAHLSDQNRLRGLIVESHRAALLSLDRYKRGAVGILEASEAVNLWIQTLLNERSAYYGYLTDLGKIARLRGSQDDENL